MLKSLYKNLKNEAKKKLSEYSEKELRKDLGKKRPKSFLFEGQIKKFITKLGHRQLSFNGINNGDLLIVNESIMIHVVDPGNFNTRCKTPVQKGTILMVLSFEVRIDDSQMYLPNLDTWFVVLSNNKLFNFDAEEFIQNINEETIRLYNLSV